MPRFRSLLPNISSRAELLDVLLRILSLGVACAVVYRYCWIDYVDPFKCSALLHEGDWLDAKDEAGSRETFQTWQPPGCMLHVYNKEDIRSCLGKKRMVISGDSTTRQIFWAIARKLDAGRANREMEELLDAPVKAKDIDFVVDHDITLQYIWDPWLNSSTTHAELEAFRKNAHHEFADNAATVEMAGLILLGAPGLWHARKGGDNHLRAFRDTVHQVIPYMDHTPYERRETSGDWAMPSTKDAARNLLLMAPVRTPWYESLPPAREETLNPERIDPMNDHLQELSSYQDLDIVSSFANMTRQQKSAYQESGFHVIRDIADAEADILLNLRCNAASAERGVYPHDGTCCMNYRRPDWRQRAVNLFSVFSAILLWINRRRRFLGRSRFLPSPGILNPFSIFTLILSFCFFADRTQIFTKEHKNYVETEFISACIITLIIGVLSVKKDNYLPRKGQTDVQSPRGQESYFLSRNQTEAWKGWMQAFLLIYHYTLASKSLWAYEVAQILGAGYLFITGYGHTIYFLTTGDYSLNRVAHVLLRLNLFVCTLAYVMRTEYTFYHFAPLSSFWFLAIYYILRINKNLNTHLTYLILKIILSACVITCLVLTPSILESVFIILKFTFRVTWDVPQLRGLIYQNLMIVYLGMIFAVLSVRFASLSGHFSPATERFILDYPLNYIRNHRRLCKTVLTVTALIILPVYWIITVAPHTKKADYDKLHPYLSPIPILCYIVLRNSTQYLQTHNSAIFIWIGKHSLEFYLLQYHIWLAGDSRGILGIGIGGRWFQGIVLGCIFFRVSKMLKKATRKLVEWILSGEARNRRGRVSGDLESPTRSSEDDGGLELLPTSGFLSPNGKGEDTSAKGYDRWGLWGDMRVRTGAVVIFAWLFNVSYR